MLIHIFVVLSSRRKLRADISTAFPLLSVEDLNELVPNKEELNIVKIYAHKGDATTLYVLHKNPIFFQLEKRLFPTGVSAWSTFSKFLFWFLTVCVVSSVHTVAISFHVTSVHHMATCAAEDGWRSRSASF